jgi:hypothetical protein
MRTLCGMCGNILGHLSKHAVSTALCDVKHDICQAVSSRFFV